MKYGDLAMLCGVRVHSNPLAMALEPVKKHRKTRSMSDTYHQRVQKKWIKRFGEKQVPGMYQIGRDIVAHPEIVAAMKREIEKGVAV